MCLDRFICRIERTGYGAGFGFRSRPKSTLSSSRRRRFSIHVSLLSALLLLWVGGFEASLLGQEESTEQAPPAPRIQPLSAFHMGGFMPNRWGGLRVDAVNPTDEDRTLQVLAYHENNTVDQFGKRVWVPANSRIVTWVPFFASRDNQTAGQQNRTNSGAAPDAGAPGISVAPPIEKPLEIRSWVSDITDGSDDLITTRTGEMQMKSTVPFALREGRSGAFHVNSQWGPEMRNMPYEAFVALRVSSKQTRRMAQLQPLEAPAFPQVLGTFDSLLIANDDVLVQTGMTEALQAWLLKGGRMWLMLDQVSIETAQEILGPGALLELVDETTLPTLTLTGSEEPTPVTVEREFDDPVLMKRVLVEGVDVDFTVDGWPAMFWVPYGRGKVMVTTVGARAWLRRFTGEDVRPGMSARSAVDELQTAFFQHDFSIIDEFKPSAEKFFESSPLPVSKDAVVKDYLTEQIGHEIPSRRFVSSMLIGFCVLLGVAGVVLLRLDRAPWMLVVCPGAAIVFALLLQGLGSANRNATPNTLAQFQVVRAVNGNAIIDVDSEGALFVGQSGERSFESATHNLLLLQRGKSSNEIRRMVWVDDEEWELTNVRLPVGQTYLQQPAVEYLNQPVVAQASFDGDGLTGKLELPGAVKPGEGVIVYEHQFAIVEFDGEGGWRVQADAPLSKNQFVAASVLSDEQARRQNFYRKLFLDQGGWEVREPILYFWDETRSVPITIPGVESHRGSSLNIVQFSLSSPAPNTPIEIPQALLRMRTSENDPEGELSVGLYSFRSGEWAQRKSKRALGVDGDRGVYYIRFQVPESVLPLRLEKAEIDIELDIMGQRVELLGVNQGSPQVISTHDSPRELISLTIDEPNLLGLNSQREWVFGLRLKELPGVEPAEFWMIQDVQVRLSGTANVTPNPAN